MTDIVDELHDWPATGRGDGMDALVVRRIMSGAASEIERLRALSPPEPTEGAKLVPIEPTREMVAAAFEAKDHVANALSRAAEGGFSSGVMCVYGAMINAAPPRAMPLQDHGKDSEIEQLKLELGKTQGEVVQRQDDLGRLLHAAEAKNEQQAKHIEELNAKMTCMCGSEINHSAWEGHSPVSMFDYAVEQEVERRLSRPMVAEEREAKS